MISNIFEIKNGEKKLKNYILYIVLIQSLVDSTALSTILLLYSKVKNIDISICQQYTSNYDNCSEINCF